MGAGTGPHLDGVKAGESRIKVPSDLMSDEGIGVWL